MVDKMRRITVPEGSPFLEGVRGTLGSTVRSVMKRLAQKTGFSEDNFNTFVNSENNIVNRRQLLVAEDVTVLTPRTARYAQCCQL